MRLIDADALLKEFESRQEQQISNYCDCFLNDAHELSTEWYCVEDMVEAAPTVDAVPVVRCKDCKHYAIDWQTCRSFCVRNGKVVGDEVWGGFAVDKNGYCNYGEKRDLEG